MLAKGATGISSPNIDQVIQIHPMNYAYGLNVLYCIVYNKC